MHEPIKTAVILAAGSGSRIQRGKRIQPKQLFKVGGLHLLERTILTLASAGITRFRVVTGAYADEVVPVIENLPSLQPYNVEFVHCHDYERGNGASLGAGAEGVEESFLVTMGDHIMSPSVVSEFVEKVAERPDLPQLAVDPDADDVFDIDDATKVKTQGGMIAEIGKEIPEYDSIDMGLFYYPAGYGDKIAAQVRNGANSVSNVVSHLIEETGFGTTPLDKPLWQDVDTPDMAKEAERRLAATLHKPTDGMVSRLVNRHVSIPISRVLASLRVKPNTITTFVFLLTCVSAAMVSSTEYLWIAIGGLLFQFCSILDGCDGEVARLSFTGTRYGAWYDTISDNVRYGIFFAALGISGYRASGANIYVWAVVLFVLLTAYMAVVMARYVYATQEHLTNLAVTAKVKEHKEEAKRWWDRYVVSLAGLIKQDVTALIAMAFCLLGLAAPMFWLALLGVAAMTVSIVRVLRKEEKAIGKPLTNLNSFVFYLIGLSLLGYLLSRMPLDTINQTLQEVGLGVLLVFIIAPFWFAANAFSLVNLTRGYNISFFQLYYTQFVGEAFNAVIPLAGLAGEPYKIRYLSNWMPMNEASQAIVRDRAIHAISGPLYVSIMLSISVALVPMSPGMTATLLAVAGILGAVALGIIALILSAVPQRLTDKLVTRFPALEEFVQWKKLGVGTFATSLGFKMLGRVINLVEIWVALKILGLAGTFDQVAIVAAFLVLSAVLFFVIPQGLGVNEVGITGAFKLLGLDPAMGITLGLIRRARVVFWAMVGVTLHLVVLVVNRLVRPLIITRQ